MSMEYKKNILMCLYAWHILHRNEKNKYFTVI